MKDINKFPRNKISLDELQSFYHCDEYLYLVQMVNQLIETNQIQPIKSSGFNGKRPGLYRSYRIVRINSEYDSWIEEIKYLAAELNGDYYIRYLEKYKIERENIQLLNQYFIQSKDKLSNKVSINERSFEIFGREKFLLKEGGMRILHNLGLRIEDLNCYETFQPLAYYSHKKNKGQIMLIIENKDTFFSMRRHLLDGNDKIFNIPIGTLIYGGGKAIYGSLVDFDLCVEPYMRAKENRILYFGDLDYEGILIYDQVRLKIKDKYKVTPFIEAYERMVRKGIFFQLPYSKELQNKSCEEEFFTYFSLDTQEKMKSILEEGKYIPQEILQVIDF